MAGITSNTVLMMHCDGTDASTTFTDDSPSAHTITPAGSAQIDTDQSVFGGASMLLDGYNDYVYIDDSDDWNFGTGDFGIDFRVRFNALDDENEFMGQTDGGSYVLKWHINWYNSTDSFRLMWHNPSGTPYTLTWSWTPSTDTWYHVAVQVVSSTAYLFIDGSLIGSGQAMSAGIPDSSGQLWVGHHDDYSSTYSIDGWMDEIRIVKGVAPIADPGDPLYIASEVFSDGFTVPTEAYTIPQFFARGLSIYAVRTENATRISSILDAIRYQFYAKNNALFDVIHQNQSCVLSLFDSRRYAYSESESIFDIRSEQFGVSGNIFDSRIGNISSSISDCFALQRQGYAIWAKNTSTGTWSELGFIDSGSTILSGVSLADGTYDIEARPWGNFWKECRDANRLRVTISGGEISDPLPPDVLNLRAGDLGALGRKLYWTWAAGYGNTTPTYFHLWFSTSSPVVTTGDQDATLSALNAGYTHVYRYDQEEAVYVAVKAYDGTNHGAVSELELDYPSGSISGPDRQWAVRGS